MNNRKTTLSRRKLLQATTAFGAVASSGFLAAPALAQSRSIKVGSYGGFFEDSFKSNVYPEFTAATGIEIESVTQPDSTGWLLTMQQAIAAGNIPADLSMHTPFNLIKGNRLGNVFQSFDAAQIPNLDNVGPDYVYQDAGKLVGVGAFSYFQALIINHEQIATVESWAELWDTDRFEASLGMPTLFNSPLWDVTAQTFFGGNEIMQTKEGLREVVAKIAELRPNVTLWYNAESQMEQALKNGDVAAGMFYHDVAGLLAADGAPISSIFPKEGNPVDYNSWTLAKGSTKSEEANEFIAFSSEPETQALMSRAIGVAPIIDRALTDLSDDEFAAVAGEPKFPMSYEVLLDNESFVEEEFAKMLAGN